MTSVFEKVLRLQFKDRDPLRLERAWVEAFNRRPYDEFPVFLEDVLSMGSRNPIYNTIEAKLFESFRAKLRSDE